MKYNVSLPSRACNVRFYFVFGALALIACFGQLFILPNNFLYKTSSVDAQYQVLYKTSSVDAADEDQVSLHLMVVPFEAYLMRAHVNVLEHRSCKKTIIVRKLLDWKDQPFTEYLDGKDELPLGTNDNLLCLQVGATVGALFMSFSNPTPTWDAISFVGSGAAEHVVQKLEHSMKQSAIKE